MGNNPDRIASNIATGIGFVGAGVIFKGDFGVNGITTAAMIWVTAALGMGIGAGYEWVSVLACILILLMLFIFSLWRPDRPDKPDEELPDRLRI